MDWLIKAGWMAWPLGACAVVALTLFIERWTVLSRRRILASGWAQNALNAVGNRAELERLPAAFARPLALATEGPKDSLHERLTAAGGQLSAQLERGVSWLATIAALAPLLGLTGTVLGMIQVFQRITVEGAGDPALLAGGIWTALITTVIGLLVAMPTLVLHRLLEGRVSARIAELEALAAALAQRAEG
jgi:biopolymer transport protein ExbB